MFQAHISVNPLNTFSTVPLSTKNSDENRIISAINRRGLGVALIGLGELFGGLLLDALSVADPDTHFELYASLDTWLSGSGQPFERILILFLDSHEMTSPTLSDHSSLQKLKLLGPPPRFIVFGTQEHHSQILKALEIGAHGFVVPSMSLRVIVQVIHLVDAGGTFVPASSFKDLLEPERKPAISNPHNGNGLSPRQLLVAKALRKGTPNKIIAYELNMCESTVKVHVRQIMKKLNAKNRTQIAFLTNAMFSDIEKS